MEEWFQSGYRSRLGQLNKLLLGAFLLVVLSLVFWGTIRHSFLATREDNPRTVEAELRIRRGKILDAGEVVLAQNEGTPARQVRVYPLPVAEPIIGYSSLRYGTAGIEGALSSILRGDEMDGSELFARNILNQPQIGQDVRLTLDISLQANAAKLMAGRPGGAILMTIPNGAVRALVSLPTYDPNTLEERFDELAADASGPLLNRITQGQYQPGLVLAPFLAAAAVENREIELATLPENLVDEPGFLDELSEKWSVEDLLDALELFGFLSAPAIPIPVAEPIEPAIPSLSEALRGTEGLVVSPLQVALAAAALGSGGERVAAQLVSGVREGDRWQAYAGSLASEPDQLISPDMAAVVLNTLTGTDNIRELATTVLSGPEETNNSWYIGLAPANQPRFVVVVILEGTENLDQVRTIGRRLLELALE